MNIVYYRIAANGWIITGDAIIQLYMIHADNSCCCYCCCCCYYYYYYYEMMYKPM